jgi:N-acetyl-alpha-D-glucosaminyl L-malate synthase BshA
MKIGIVCYPTFGGSGVIATELGKALANEGHHIHFITYQLPVRLNTFSENIFFHDVSLENYPLFDYPPYETVLASKIVDVVRSENLDILHVHYAIPHASAALMAKQILQTFNIQIPIITTLHGTDITLVGKDKSYEPVVTYSINNSDGVSAVSKSLRDETLQHFNIKKEIEVIPNFVDFNRFKKNNKDHFKQVLAPNGEKILIHASNFRKVKRINDVIQVFAKIHQQIPAKLLMVGDGPERKNAENLCASLNVCNDVRFLGRQDAMEEILAICDVFIMPSEKESFGLAALEAMACEVPVISTNVGGLPEIVLHNINGGTFNVGDIEGMADFGIQLLKDVEQLNRFKNAAFQTAKLYDIKNILPMYESLYQKVLFKS